MVLPAFAALVIVLVLFGKAIWAYIDLTQAADEAARLATVNQPQTTSLESYLRSLSALPGGAHLAICYPASGSRAVGQPVEVEAYANANWVPFLNIGSIKGTATMRLEQSTTGNASLDPSAGGCNQ